MFGGVQTYTHEGPRGDKYGIWKNSMLIGGLNAEDVTGQCGTEGQDSTWDWRYDDAGPHGRDNSLALVGRLDSASNQALERRVKRSAGCREGLPLTAAGLPALG